MSGKLLDLKDEVTLEVALDKKAETALKQIFESIRERQLNLTFRFKVAADPSSLISQVLAVDLTMSVERAMELMKEMKEESEMRLKKRSFSLLDEMEESSEKLILGFRNKVLDYSYLSNKKGLGPITSISLRKCYCDDDSAEFRLNVSLKRKFLSHLIGIDFKKIEGRLPNIKAKIMAEIGVSSVMKYVELLHLRMTSSECAHGEDEFALKLRLSIDVNVLRSVIKQPKPRNFVIRGSGSGLVALLLNAFETGFHLGDTKEVYLTKRKSHATSKTKKMFQQVKQIFHVDQRTLRKREHLVKTSIRTDERSVVLGTGVQFAKKRSTSEWPYISVDWGRLEFSIRPIFTKRKYDRLFRSTTLASIVVPEGRMNVLVAPCNTFELLFDGAVSLQVVLKEKRSYTKATLLDTVDTLSKEFKPDLLHSISINHDSSKLIQVSLGTINYLFMKFSKANKMENIFRLNREAQLALIGLEKGRINLMIPLPITKRIPFPKLFRRNELRLVVSMPKLRGLVCYRKDNKYLCPASGGVDKCEVHMKLAHNQPLYMAANHMNRDRRNLKSHVFGHAEIISFTEGFSLIESLLLGGERRISFGRPGVKVPWESPSLLERLINAVGSRLLIELPKPKLQSMEHYLGDKAVKMKRNHHLQLLTAIKSNSPTHLHANIAIRLPRSAVVDEDKFSDPINSDYFIMSWGNVKVRFACAGVGSVEVKMRKGKVGVRLSKILKKRTLRSIVATTNRLFSVHVSLDSLYNSVSAPRTRQVLETILYYLDWDDGHVYPMLRSCLNHRHCRRMLRGSNHFNGGFQMLDETEVVMEFESSSFPTVIPSNRVLSLKRGLMMIKRLWKAYGRTIIDRLGPIKSYLKTKLPEVFEAIVELKPHPKIPPKLPTRIPEVLPHFSRTSFLGKVDIEKRELAMAVVQIKKIIPFLCTHLAEVLSNAYRIFDFTRYPMMVSVMMRMPKVELAAGINRIDIVEVDVESFEIVRSINVATMTIDKLDEEVEAQLKFAADIAEFPFILSPFGITPYGQISVFPAPNVQIKEDELNSTHQSPLVASLSTSRMYKREANLLSVLVSSLPDIPIFSVTDSVDPFNYRLELLDSELDCLHFSFSGLRMYNPLPMVTVDLKEVKATVLFEDLPFFMVNFGHLVLNSGSTNLPCTIVFSKTAFGAKNEALVRKALNELVELGVAGSKISVTILVVAGKDVRIRLPLSVPVRQYPELSEIMEFAQPTDEMREDLEKIVKDLAPGLVRAGAEAAKTSLMNKWESYVSKLASPNGKMKLEEKRKKKVPVRLRNTADLKNLMSLSVPVELPFDSSLLGFDVEIDLDAASKSCPSIIPFARSKLNYWNMRMNLALPETSDPLTCPALMEMKANNPLTISSDLISVEDLASGAMFGLQGFSNLMHRYSVCASVKVHSAVVRVRAEKGEAFVLPLSFEVKNIPAFWDSRINACGPPSCSPDFESITILVICLLTCSIESIVRSVVASANEVRLDSKNYKHILTDNYDIRSSYHISFRFKYTSAISSINLYWSTHDKRHLVYFRIIPSGAALLVKDNVVVERLELGLFPVNVENNSWVNLTCFINPYEKKMRIDMVGETHYIYSSATLPIRLFDYLPIKLVEPVQLGVAVHSSALVILTDHTINQLLPSFRHSRLFHLAKKPPRVFQVSTVAVQLLDICGDRLGKVTSPIKAVLFRVSDDLRLRPWKPVPTQYEYGPFRLDHLQIFTNITPSAYSYDDCIPTRLTFDVYSGTYILEFTPTAPGRYRIFFQYQGIVGDAEIPFGKTRENVWYLLQSNHVIITI